MSIAQNKIIQYNINSKKNFRMTYCYIIVLLISLVKKNVGKKLKIVEDYIIF